MVDVLHCSEFDKIILDKIDSTRPMRYRRTFYML